jgi:nucleotide-binding universal stress UspA family protein
VIELLRILAPTDFSEFSRRALEHAIALARWYGSRITVLHVHLASDEPVGKPPDEELSQFVDQMAASGVSIEPVVIEEMPAAGILAHARRLPADLIALGTHGRAGFDRWELGSVTEKVVRKAPCPVLTIPRRAEEAKPRPLFKRILCACDFSEASMKALDYAFSLAKEADARLTLLHVLEWVPNMTEERRSLEEDALRRLHEAVPESARDWFEPEEKVTAGKAYLEILRVAQADAAELIVLGVQGRGAIDRMFFGSTAQHVVRGAACPVLSVRPIRVMPDSQDAGS